ncbi:serine hydrolase domain-containing protein [Agromyces sp. NPDC056523]|uniref:serine hydrolase domain-containing protein n=1 Tax=Agromyces sp. NPDC056523 TaxID=3345850 RepID=UPI00366FD401
MRAMRGRLLAGVATAAMAVMMTSGCSAMSPEAEAEAEAGAEADGGTAAGPTGDDALLRAIRPSFTQPDDVVAVALLDGDQVRTAFIDASHYTVFETGSITKTFTGLLLAEAIERGEVELDDTLGEHLDLGTSPAVSVTLGDLAAHRSGLPTFPSDPAWRERIEPGFLAGEDVIDESVDELLAEAAAETLPPEPEPMYSNMGAALVGQALAAAAGTEYRDLLTERILEPLALDGASLPVEDDEVPAGLAQGRTADGAPAEPSTLGAYAPAGGIAATVDDLVAYAAAVIDGPFADSAALEPRPGLDGGSIGYFWGVTDEGGHRFVEHDGMTAGFGSSLVIDLTAGTAAVILVNRADGSATGVARTLLSLAEG